MNQEGEIYESTSSSVRPMEVDNNEKKESDDEYSKQLNADKNKRFEFLINQTELFAHFINDTKNKKQTQISKRNANDEQAANKSMSVIHTYTESPEFIINGQLRNYQIDGLNWLIRLYENGLNGILADEMGLGKTIQTISLLGYLKHVKNISGPHLIIVPLSTLRNWRNEIEKFCPTLRAITLAGEKDERKLFIKENIKTKRNSKKKKKSDENADEIEVEELVNNWDVMLTTYEMAIKKREKGILKKFNWRYLIIDEAHRIKAINTKLSCIVREFKCQNRLLITGTPLQNNLQELWSLLNFLLPDVFNSDEDFLTWFDEKQLNADETLIQRLYAVLKPFLLRRIKNEVEKSLLPKKEIFIYSKLTNLQISVYKSILLNDATNLNGNIKLKQLMNIIMHLRKCCVHPYLFPGVEKGPPYTTDQHLVDASSKMIVLDALLDRLKSQGHRCLLFSQFVLMLDIIEDYLIWKNFKYFRLDGNSNLDERQKMIDAYNAPNSEYFIFIISTRAGGLGINLATADTVIIYDSDWNPQMDLQAVDRAHRIGQTKQVIIYRLITENTIEEKIIAKARAKLNLERMVIQKHNNVSKEADNELANPLKLHKDECIELFNQNLEFLLETCKNRDKNGMTSDDIDLDNIIEASKTRQEKFESDKESPAATSKAKIQTKEILSQVNSNIEKLTNATFQMNYDTYDFLGENYRDKAKIESNNYGSKWIGDETRVNTKSRNARPLKQIDLPKFRFYSPLLANLIERESYAHKRAINYTPMIDSNIPIAEAKNLQRRELEKIYSAVELSEEEQLEKDRLMKEGFPDWTNGEYLLFARGSKLFGRNEIEKIADHIKTKSSDEVKRYAQVFWSRYCELPNYQATIASIANGERKIKMKSIVKECLNEKMIEAQGNFTRIQLTYPAHHRQRQELFTPDEDKYILYMYHKYNGIERGDDVPVRMIKIERRFVNAFKFNWHFLGCQEDELKKRLKILLNLIEYEYMCKIEGANASENQFATQSSDSGYNNNHENTNKMEKARVNHDINNNSNDKRSLILNYESSDDENVIIPLNDNKKLQQQQQQQQVSVEYVYKSESESEDDCCVLINDADEDEKSIDNNEDNCIYVEEESDSDDDDDYID